MIKKEFWERVAENWSKKEEIVIPEIDKEDIPDVPLDNNDMDDLDSYLNSILDSDEDEFDVTDFFG